VTAADTCRHELLLGTCVDCRPRPSSTAGDRYARPQTFEARYAGRCNACDERFEAGDDVMRLAGELIHPECFDE
jgi:hypothetical protein